MEVVLDADTAVVSSNGLADHAMGPYGRNPNTEIAQDHVYRIPLSPGEGGEATSLGAVAVLYNGVPLFNPSDGRDLGGCTGNAGFLEADHIDEYGGHLEASGIYHYHSGAFLAHATELGIAHEDSQHSPILGYSFDGYPIYGPYGYADGQDPASPITRLDSGYVLKTERDCCAIEQACGVDAEFDGKELQLGAFLEDYEYDAAGFANETCHLNEWNMRFQITPEYPEGTFAYIVTMADDFSPVFPYALALEYFGPTAE